VVDFVSMRRFLPAGLLCAIQLCADTYPRQPGLDARHYIFRLSLSDDTDEIAGEATIEFGFVQDGVTEIALDLVSGMTVAEVTSGGEPLRFSRQSDRLILALPSPPPAGDVRQFTVRYRGIPANGLRIGVNRYGERTFFSQNWPNLAKQWLPMIDHPYDKATSEFIITAPSKYQVIANGLLQEQTDLGDGRRLTHWKESVPIASWLNAIGVAQFASRHFDRAHGIPLET
jgi:aminopeptidase N